MRGIEAHAAAVAAEGGVPSPRDFAFTKCASPGGSPRGEGTAATRRSHAAFWLAVIISFFVAPLHAAKVRVEGAGFFRDRDLRGALERVLEADHRESFDANAIEDAAVILTSALGDEGFQSPEVTIEATLAGGAKRSFTFDPTFATPLPRPLAAEEVTFHLKRGVRSYVADVTFDGLTALPTKRARAFFRTDSTLIGTERTNAFSPGKVSRGVDALLSELRGLGYAEAQVRSQLERKPDGPVIVHVTANEGPRWKVSNVTLSYDGPTARELPKPEEWENKPWTPSYEVDLREAVRQAYYRDGYPDVGVHVAAEPARPNADGVRDTEVTVTIVPGPHVEVGAVRFEGNTVTRDTVLRRRVSLQAGEPLDPVALEHARFRISRLGVFESVDLRYEPEDGPRRDPVFTVREGQRYETNLLFGYGSYEQLRGGVEYRQMNILGLAHQSRLELIQSMKSTSGDYTYTVPELFGESLDGTARLFGLQRREIAFLRQEFGASFSLRRPVRRFGGEATIGYTFQALRNRRSSLSTEATDEKQKNVASLDLSLTGDRRDNPLRPRHGYHWSAQAELADPKLGGNATYQRFEVAAAYHTGWGAGRWIHLGFSHGVITTAGDDNDLSVPVNKRFYPGGDNSIRGYQRGEAAPRDAAGRFIGAKAYLLGNVELEQALTPSWSIVAFGDALGSAVALRDYPFEQRLYSVGLGIRYQTLIGPIRLEYARNINPRPDDPPGTWQIAIGYPF